MTDTFRTVGRAPWPAWDALVPHHDQADEGVGRGPGGPPHNHAS